MKDNNYLFPLAALALCCLALNFAPDFLYCRGTAVKFLLLPGLAVLACAALYLKKNDGLDGPASLFLLGSAAFLLHASFVLAIPYDEMQHDLFELSERPPEQIRRPLRNHLVRDPVKAVAAHAVALGYRG